MSKFVLSMGLGLASLAGLAGAVEAASSTSREEHWPRRRKVLAIPRSI